MLHKIFNTVNIQLSRLGVVLLAILIFCMSSCSKDKELDTDLLSIKNDGSMISFVALGNVVLLSGQNYNFTNKYAGIPVSLTEASKSADTVIAKVAPELVSVYNSAHMENNPSIPEGTFEVAHNGIFPIAAGETNATDSLSIILKNGTSLNNKTVYLVPVKIETRNGGKSKYSVYFFKMLISKGELTAKMYGASIFNNTTAGRISGGALSLVYINAYPDSLKFRTSISSLFPLHETDVEATQLTDAQVDSIITAKRFGGNRLPATNYEVTKNLTKIPPTSVLSRDSITVRFKNRSSLKTLQYYTMGLKLKTYTGSAYGVKPVPNDSAMVLLRFFLL